MPSKKTPLDPITIRSVFSGYQGNKYSLMSNVLPFIPKHCDTFVDLFGGSGTVCATVLANNRCKRVVYNDLEYDLALFMKWFQQAPWERIVEEVNATWKEYFGDAVKLTKEQKPAFLKMREDYNTSREALWELEDQKGLLLPTKMFSNKEGELRREKDGGKYVYFSTDNFNPAMFYILTTCSFFGTPAFSNNGKKFMPQMRNGRKNRIQEARPFHEAIYGKDMEIFSVDVVCSFIYGKPYKRPRQKGMIVDFRKLIDSLGKNDFVYLDPPYHGSGASYNSHYDLSTEAYVLSIMALLNERGVPFLLSNNLDYDKSLLRHYLGMAGFHTFVSEVEYKRNGGLDTFKSCHECYVTNFPMPASKRPLPDSIREIKNPKAYLQLDDLEYFQFLALKDEHPELIEDTEKMAKLRDKVEQRNLEFIRGKEA